MTMNLERLRRAPIVLGNAPSTGSSLLRARLAMLDGIFSGDESSVLDRPRLFDLAGTAYRQRIGRHLDEGFHRDFVGGYRELFSNFDSYPIERGELERIAHDCDGYPELLRRFFDACVRATDNRRWLEKTPPTVYCFDAIERVFPDARFIHLVRDARDVMASFRRRGGSPFAAASQWYAATVTGVQHRDRTNHLEVRYEDLVYDPAPTLERICAFIGEPWDAALCDERPPNEAKIESWRLNPSEAIRSTAVGTHHDLDEETRSVFRWLELTPAIRATFHDHSTIGVPAALDLQRRLGYDVDGLLDAPPPSRATKSAVAREVRRWQWRSFRQDRFWPRCPTRIAKTDPVSPALPEEHRPEAKAA